MVRNRNRIIHQTTPPCVDITAPVVAALDAADAAAVEAVVHDRPMCPVVEQTDSAVVALRLPDGTLLAIGVWSDDCEPCARAVRAIERHPLLRYNTPARRDFLAELHASTARRHHV